MDRLQQRDSRLTLFYRLVFSSVLVSPSLRSSHERTDHVNNVAEYHSMCANCHTGDVLAQQAVEKKGLKNHDVSMITSILRISDHHGDNCA